MKRSCILIGLVLYFSVSSFAQTNLFPPNGNVGIGTTNPLTKLSVVGGITSTDNSNINGVSFTVENTYYKQLKATGYNLTISTGSGDGSLLIPFRGDDFAHFTNLGLIVDKNVSIGTDDSKGYKLAVAGNMIAESVKVKLQGAWPDYVFSKNYRLPSLIETEKHIKEKGHLPEIPSAAEVKANGLDMENMNSKLLRKIEELTLYVIDLNKKSVLQEIEVQKLRKEFIKLKSKK